MNISELSIKRPNYVIVLFLVIAVLGALGYAFLQAELMPKFTPPSMNVQVVYPGGSPSEVESSLTRKLEDALSSLQGIESMRSYSFEGMSMVFVSFLYGTDIDKAMTDAHNKIGAIKAELPAAALAPMINKITVDERPAMRLAVTSDLEAMEFSDLVDHHIIPDLLRIPGMAKVEAIGGHPREIQVNLDMEALRALGITPLQVLGSLRSANLDFPTGSLRSERTNTTIRLSGRLQGVEEIRNIVIMTLPTGTQVHLSDIAEIIEAAKDRNRIARIDGRDAVILNLFKQGDANAIDLSNRVERAGKVLENNNAGHHLAFSTISDTASFTRESIKSVFTDLLLAILLVTLVILIFLHNWRDALIVMFVVPLSIIGAFIGMKVFRFTLNMMSLLGLSVVIGVLVDDAIVVVENVYRHLESGKKPLQATLDAMREIGNTIVTITLVLVIVFLPIALTNSLVSDILRQFCGVIIFAILFSLLSALTLVPLLMSRFGRVEKPGEGSLWRRSMLWFENAVRDFGEQVARALRWSLGHKRWVAVAVLAGTVLVCSLFPTGFIGFEFMPDVDQSEFSVILEMPKDISMDESSKMVARAESWLLSQPEIKEIATMIGLTSSSGESRTGSPYLAEITVKTVPPSERDLRINQYIARLRGQLSDYLVDARVRMFAAAIHGAANSADIEYIISGNSADSVASFGEYALAVLREIPGTLQQQLSGGTGMPEVQITVDRDKMSALGLSLDNVGLTLQMAFQGNTSIKYVENDYEYDINIRADRFYRESIDDVSNLTFVNTQGSQITLDQFANIRLGTGPNRLERYNRNPSLSISANVIGISSGAASSTFLSQVEEEARKVDVTLATVGEMKSMSNSMSVMGLALILSLLLIYLAMVVLYNNWIDPLVVMVSIPFSILGAVLALALSGTSLNIYAMLGLVMLVGLVAKNAILLVDFANVQLRAGHGMDESLEAAVRLRTRPILMTALSTIIGMIPVALATGSSSELRNGIGWVIIGGMLLSTLLTLVIIPVVFKIFHADKKSTETNKHKG